MTRDSVIYPVDSFIQHPQFVFATFTNDIALISVSIHLNSYVQPAMISANYLPDNSNIQELSGWNPPQQTNVFTIPLRECQARYTNTPLATLFITADHVCLAQKNDVINTPFSVSATY